jgi:hypothetical protein
MQGLQASSSHSVTISVENGHAHSVAVLDGETGAATPCHKRQAICDA